MLMVFSLELQKTLVLYMNFQLIELYFVSKQLPAKIKIIQNVLQQY